MICTRCGCTLAQDAKGNYANATTLSYRCLTVGQRHTPETT
jgi:hypothetical protein